MSSSSTPPFAHVVEPDASAGAVRWSWNVATNDLALSEGIDETLFGLPPGSFGGTFEAYLALVHPEDRAYFQAVIARTLAGEDELVVSHRAVWPDGTVHWIDGRGRLTRDENGKPLVLTGVAWTASARKNAEAKLTHLGRVHAVASAVSRELLRVTSVDEAFDLACRIAVEHGHFRFAWIGLVAHDDARVRPVARAGHEDGYLDEIMVTVDRTPHGMGPVGRAVREARVVVVNDAAHDTSFAPWREPALRRGYCGCIAFPLRRDGAVIGTLAIYAAERNRFDVDQIELLTGLADDIGFKLDALDADARRRAAERASRRSEERYRALVEQAADAILLADADGRLIEVNAAACTMIGRAREALVGQFVDALFEPVELRDSRGTQTALSGERRLRKDDGTIVDAEVTSIVLADGRVQISARDVTQRNIAQQQLILADRLASLGRLAAGVAHEINNPLTYVALNLERIERESQADPSAGAMARIRNGARDARDGAERVRDIVRALGAFSREDEGAVGAIDLHRVIDGALRLAENNVRQRARVIKRYGAVRGVRGNELRLGQVFVNLLVNAADAFPDRTPEENEIHVRTFDEGECVIVELRDNGVGIEPEIIGRIFDPFFTTKPVGEGTGLGLSISHGIVAAFGGRIDVESRPGKGTAFRVSLVADATIAGPSRDATAPESSRTPPSKPTRPRVLIVDDEERLARSLALSLEGHEVAIATSGRAALASIQSHAFDCIVCDLMMPDLSGMDLHAELTRAGGGHERRMIFMTGGAFTARARAFVDEVPNEVIEKPFSTARLETAITAIVAREGRR